MNRKLLIVYASRYGQTEKIARRIAEVAHGDAVALAGVTPAMLDEASDVIVAGAIYFGKHERALVRFVKENLAALAKRHTAFVSVCGDADEPNPDLERAQSYVVNFQRESGWTPNASAVFAGGVAYSRYWWLLRFVVRRMARSRGLGTDTSRDYEYTDWNAVETFARKFVEEAQARVA